jgi:type IX secretion system substrate protein
MKKELLIIATVIALFLFPKVNFGQAPVITVEPKNQTTCPGGSASFAIVATGTNLTYQWKKGNTILTDGGHISGSTTSTLNIFPASTADASSNYFVVVTGSNGISAASSYTSLIVSNLPNPTITSGANQICPGGSTTLNAGTYSSYSWNNGGRNQTITITSPGTYSVTVTSNAGCTGAGNKTINAFSAPVPNILDSGLMNLCAGGSATMWVGATYPSYNWNTGEATRSITFNTANTYVVTVTNSNGCTGTASLAEMETTCNTPTNLQTTNIGSTSATANFNTAPCYYNYSIRECIHNTYNWVTYTFAPNDHYSLNGLAMGTTYDWQIRTNCNSGQTIYSDWSAVQTFSTSASRIADFETNPVTFNVYPNPANEQVTIAFSADNASIYSIRIIDMTGRIMQTEEVNSVAGDNMHTMGLNGLAKGIYILELRTGDDFNKVKLMIQ